MMALTAIFFVVDPIAVVPAFLAMTARESPEQKANTALRASVTAFVTLAVFAAAGTLIFRLFGISLGAFRVAGGVILFLLALDMVQARPSRTRSTPEEEQEGVEKDDVAIIPLGIPLLSGPGAIATVMVFVGQKPDAAHIAIVIGAVAVTCVIAWAMLRGAAFLERRLSRTFINVVTRLMGLILAAVAVEFVAGGVRELMRAGGSG